MKKFDTYGDREYPDNDKVVEGFRKSNLTWEKIADIDYFGKTVLDVGCNNAYFLLKTLQKGAKFCYGIDLNGFHTNINMEGYDINDYFKPLGVGEDILNKWGFNNYELIEGDWETLVFNKKVSISLCFNTLHYFKNINEGLNKLFLITKELVILETNINAQSIAHKHGFKLIKTVKSHWNSRTIQFWTKTKRNRK